MEAQHHVSTTKLTDNREEQSRLEELIEATKPTVPVECRDLHFLLFTPFRYSPYPDGSRFRRAGLTPGVFYASELPTTAIAEKAFYKLLVFAESPATPWPQNADEYTVFAAEYATDYAVDLTIDPFKEDRAVWTHPTDYDACQSFAAVARTAEVNLIKYQSARDLNGCNIAILTCGTFAKPAEVARQTWRIYLSASGVRVICEMPAVSIDFDRNAFLPDPRIATLEWERT